MIAILCSSFYEATDRFYQFLEILDEQEPWRITKVFQACNCVETDENLRYIFVDRRERPMFERLRSDIIDCDLFFEELEFLEGLVII